MQAGEWRGVICICVCEFCGGRCIFRLHAVVSASRGESISLSFMRLFCLASPLRRLSAQPPPPIYTPRTHTMWCCIHFMRTQLYTRTRLWVDARNASMRAIFPYFGATCRNKCTHTVTLRRWAAGNAFAGGASSRLYHSSSKCQRRKIFI
jgi:hypothetical protein